MPIDTIKIWLSQFLVHKFIMKNTAVLLCSNIVLQEGGKKNSSVQNNSPGSDGNKEQHEAEIWEGELNWVQTNHTIKLNSIPENKQNDFKTHK